MPAGNSPAFSGTVDLTPDILNAMKKAGTNPQGNYSLRFALWDNDKRDKDTSPHFKGQVTVNKLDNSPKAYASMWDNGNKAKQSFSDDPF